MTPEQLDEIEKLLLPRFPTDVWHAALVKQMPSLVKALREAWARCETLRGLADEKAHDAGLYARRMGQAQKALREASAKHNEALDMCQRYMGHLHKALEERDAARADRDDALAILARVAEQLGVSADALAEDSSLAARAAADLRIAHAFHDVAVKERDFKRVRCNRVEQERDEARAACFRLESERNQAVKDRDASYDAIESARATIRHAQEQKAEAVRQRDAARAEVERLRAALGVKP